MLYASEHCSVISIHIFLFMATATASVRHRFGFIAGLGEWQNLLSHSRNANTSIFGARSLSVKCLLDACHFIWISPLHAFASSLFPGFRHTQILEGELGCCISCLLVVRISVAVLTHLTHTHTSNNNYIRNSPSILPRMERTGKSATNRLVLYSGDRACGRRCCHYCANVTLRPMLWCIDSISKSPIARKSIGKAKKFVFFRWNVFRWNQDFRFGTSVDMVNGWWRRQQRTRALTN